MDETQKMLFLLDIEVLLKTSFTIGRKHLTIKERIFNEWVEDKIRDIKESLNEGTTKW